MGLALTAIGVHLKPGEHTSRGITPFGPGFSTSDPNTRQVIVKLCARCGLSSCSSICFEAVVSFVIRQASVNFAPHYAPSPLPPDVASCQELQVLHKVCATSLTWPLWRPSWWSSYVPWPWVCPNPRQTARFLRTGSCIRGKRERLAFVVPTCRSLRQTLPWPA